MGGGGGDGGFQERADAENRRKAQGRDAVNALFGVAPSLAAGAAPDRARFQGTQTYQSGGGDNGVEYSTVPTFDQAGFDAAQAEYNRAAGLGQQAAQARAGRDALYRKVRDDFFGAGRRQVDEQKAEADRRLKFDLFERGLNGSTIASDKVGDLGRKYDQGIIDLGAKADAARADLQGSDEQTRLSLLQSLDNGMDAGSATSSAINQMRVASDKAASGAQGANIGDLFGDVGLGVSRVQQRKNAMDAYDQWRRGTSSQAGPLYSTTGG